MTALEAMEVEMNKLSRMANECICDAGYIHSDRRYEYQELVEKIRKVRECLLFLEDLKNRRSELITNRR